MVGEEEGQISKEESEGNEDEVSAAEDLMDVEALEEDQVMTEDLQDVEQKTEDMMAEELTDETEDDVEGETVESSEDTPEPQRGSRYGSPSYGSRHSNIGGSSSFGHGGFGGHRFSNPSFFRNIGSGSSFGRDRFGSGRTSFHHQTFGFRRN